MVEGVHGDELVQKVRFERLEDGIIPMALSVCLEVEVEGSLAIRCECWVIFFSRSRC